MALANAVLLGFVICTSSSARILFPLINEMTDLEFNVYLVSTMIYYFCVHRTHVKGRNLWTLNTESFEEA